MIENRWTIAALNKLLLVKYKCERIGKLIPPPYKSPDDMPTWYRSPNGFNFEVPDPNNGVDYSEEYVEKIISTARLEEDVVIQIAAKKSPTGTED